jgi:hypothetical protein
LAFVDWKVLDTSHTGVKAALVELVFASARSKERRDRRLLNRETTR